MEDLLLLAATEARMQNIGLGVGLGTVLFIALIVFIKANLVICQPNEIVIISGRARRHADGVTRGYRVLRGGVTFKTPLFESVSRLTLTNMPIEVVLRDSLSGGMIPLNVEGRGQVKIASTPETGLDNAIERFLGRPLSDISKVARETLEGNLRAVIATVTPAEANAQRGEIAAQVSSSSAEMLRQLGLVLDFFQVQTISDDQDHLKAIGRRKNAEVQRDAQIAEARAEAEAREVTAGEKQRGRLAELAAETEVSTAEHRLHQHQAGLEGKTNEAQARAAVAREIARLEEEARLEEQRVTVSQRREEAQTVIPAQAEAKAMALKSEGYAARILENGKATAEAIRLMQEQWQDGKTKELFMIRMFPELVEKVSSTVAKNLQVDRLTVLDSGDGDGLPRHVKGVTNSALVLLEQVKNATGLDLPDLLQEAAKKEGSRAEDLPRELK